MTAPIDKFMFSIKAGEEQKKDLELKTEALEERINSLAERAKLNEFPILHNILAISHDKGELERLGKALQRVAELMPELDELKRRKSIVELAIQDPGWLAATFGDFDQEVESITIEDLK